MVEKEWLLLLYLNGNNDLAPEMMHSFWMAKEGGFGTQVTLVVQIALAPKQMVALIRPERALSYDTTFMNGRYVLEKNSAILLEPMFNVNMADPSALESFIIWSTKRFPAKKTMLYLGGHGYEYRGCMLDFTGGNPTMMAYKDMAQAITNGMKINGKKMDLLFVDTCHMNHERALITLCRYGAEGIHYLLVPKSVSAMEGYPMDQIVGIFSDENIVKEVLYFIALLLQMFPDSLCSYRLVPVDMENTVVESVSEPILISDGEIYAWISNINPMMTEEKKKRIFIQFKKYLKLFPV